MTSRYAYEKKESIESLREKNSIKQTQTESKATEVKETNEVSMREYDTLKSQMNDLLNKMSGFEDDQKEIEVLKVEQNGLKENYLRLEEKYLTLEEVKFLTLMKFEIKNVRNLKQNAIKPRV